MGKIRFFALGGLGENGKNMFVVEVDDKIFILDAGNKVPSVDLYGVDAVIPNINYLIENRKKIQGIFLSHGHEGHIGAVPEILRNIKVNVYGTKFTLALVELSMMDAGLNVNDYKLYRISDNKVLGFNNVNVRFYNTSHSIPESLGIAIETTDGTIVYAPDFTFSNSNDIKYQTSYDKICEIGKNGVLALISESMGVTNIDRVSNDYSLIYTASAVLQEKGRVIFSMYSNDLDRIQKIVNLSLNHDKRIAIIGTKVQKIINIAINSGYLKIPSEKLVSLKFLDDNNTNNDDDLVVIVTGLRHEPYYALQRMCNGIDRLISIDEGDRVVIIAPPSSETEKIAAKTLDILSRKNAAVTNITKSMLKSSHADSEDLKVLYGILKPKYIIPSLGEYRHQYTQKNIAIEAGYDEKNIIMIDNGDVITFKDGALIPQRSKIEVFDVLVDGSIVGDINEVVIHDREVLASDGTILVVLNVDSERRIIIDGPKIISKGFVSSTSNVDLNNIITEVVNSSIERYFEKRYFDMNELKTSLREDVNKAIYKSTKRKPVVITTIIDMA